MTALPPPAATVRRVRPATVLAAGASGTTLHLLPEPAATRCGRRTAAGWSVWQPTDTVPALRVCARCLAGLPTATRTKLTPTPAEAAAAHSLEVRTAASNLADLIGRVRTASLLDGSADELVELTVAEPIRDVVADALARGRFPAPLRRVDRNAQPAAGTFVATERRLRLLELVNQLDPTGHALPGQRVWLTDGPTPGALVDTGGTYDARPWRGRIR